MMCWMRHLPEGILTGDGCANQPQSYAQIHMHWLYECPLSLLPCSCFLQYTNTTLQQCDLFQQSERKTSAPQASAPRPNRNLNNPNITNHNPHLISDSKPKFCYCRRTTRHGVSGNLVNCCTTVRTSCKINQQQIEVMESEQLWSTDVATNL